MTDLSKTITELSIPPNSGNEIDSRFFILSDFLTLKRIVIGDESFDNVYKFSIEGLVNLESFVIGKNCFTASKNGRGDDPHRTFAIVNCPKLIIISIGCYSFSDYSGEFKITNCGSLQEIKIGEVGYESCNFHDASLDLRSRCRLRVSSLDLPSLKQIEMGNKAFCNAENVKLESGQA